MKISVVFLPLILCLHQGACALYKDLTDTPFQEGPLAVDSIYLEEDWFGPPMDTAIVFPSEPEEGTEYAVAVFISGFYGQVSMEEYETILRQLASHGYIVIAPWPLFDISVVEVLDETLQWLVRNMRQFISATPSWDDMAIGCHSAGCDNVRDFLRDKTQYNVKGTLMIEPASFFLDDSEPHNIPALMYAGELAAAGSCSVDGLDYRAFYNVWNCPKYLIVAESFGHCDFMEDGYREDCKDFCDSGPDDRIEDYRLYVQGLMAAMFNFYVQESPEYQKYLTDMDTHPMQILEYTQDTECTV